MTGLIAKLLRYVFTGGVAAIVDAGGFALLIVKQIPVMPAGIISFSLAALVNFQLTSRLVFKQEATRMGFVLFFLTALVGLVVNLSTTLLGIAFLNLSPLLAKLLGIGTAFLLNFTLNIAVVFREKERLLL